MTIFTARPSKALAPVAIALLNPAVLGSVVVAGGVLAGAAAHYAPAVYEAGQMAVDSLGNFSRTLYQAEKFAVTSGLQYVVGRLEQLQLSVGGAGSDVYEWIKRHPLDVPNLSSAFLKSFPPIYSTPPASINSPPDLVTPGSVVPAEYNSYLSTPFTANRKVHITGSSWQTSVAGCVNPLNAATLPHMSIQGSWAIWIWAIGPSDCNTGNVKIMQSSTLGHAETILPNTEFPLNPFQPDLFQRDLNGKDPALISPEVDKLLQAYPLAAVGAEPWTNGDESLAGKIAQSAVASTAATAADAAVAQDPTNTALQIAATEARTRADQAAIEAQTGTQDTTDTPIDLSGTYNPDSLTNDYTPDTALNNTSQFTDRFTSFVDTIKAAPLFSLPNQVLFNIPNSSTSIYTINMGSYGNADIDFSSFGSALVIFRSALLICFGYASIRIAATGK